MRLMSPSHWYTLYHWVNFVKNEKILKQALHVMEYFQGKLVPSTFIIEQSKMIIQVFMIIIKSEVEEKDCCASVFMTRNPFAHWTKFKAQLIRLYCCSPVTAFWILGYSWYFNRLWKELMSKEQCIYFCPSPVQLLEVLH